jgi:hypothetical protein
MRNRTSKFPEPHAASFTVIDDFLPTDVARTMRTDIEQHFADPHKHRPETHQIWNYWCVPGLYTYLRTQPEKVILRSKVEFFVRALREWSIDVLGLGSVTWPYLSLYVGGCSQGLHNDSQNGRFAFVYSLTRIERRTNGGDTIIMREGDLFRLNLRAPRAGIAFRDLIEPRFNRLVVFDDRLVHGVEPVNGSMDPTDGRCVLHGHIEESGPVITGEQPIGALREGIRAAIDVFIAERSAAIQLYHGPLVIRFTVLPDGRVTGAHIILDRVMDERDDSADWDQVKMRLIEVISKAVFPTALRETNVTLPISFGGPVRTGQSW